MDLVQSEYGWLDETVLDLAICRLRQIVAVVEERKKYERLHLQTIAEWQTRTTVQFIAATVPVEKGKKNPLADAADKVRLRLEDEKGESPSDVPIEEFIEKGSQVAENAPGSFERLMGGFGG